MAYALTDHDWEPFAISAYVPLCFPDYMIAGVQRYLAYGEPVGGYLTALFEGRCFDAVCNADGENLASFAYQAKWIAQHAPTGAFGSPAKVTAWIEAGGLAGIEPGWRPKGGDDESA